MLEEGKVSLVLDFLGFCSDLKAAESEKTCTLPDASGSAPQEIDPANENEVLFTYSVHWKVSVAPGDVPQSLPGQKYDLKKFFFLIFTFQVVLFEILMENVCLEVSTNSLGGVLRADECLAQRLDRLRAELQDGGTTQAVWRVFELEDSETKLCVPISGIDVCGKET